ncbi:MAG TPA: M1 family aminopeptidase [Candidatus Kapabacteria bacterium]|nr:M1 family aminopeptidase [Candidatus Kapabacteria bacterium]
MNHFYRLSLTFVLLAFPLRTFAQGLGWDYQEQARSHIIDISHIEMHISFDEPAKKMMGTVIETVAILPQKNPVKEFRLDAVNMTVERVWLEEGRGKMVPLQFNQNDSAKLAITLDRVHPWNTTFVIGIEYWAKPTKGMFFIEPDTFYTTKPEQIWTQGEGMENRNWIPIYDYPNVKATTDMYVTVRADQKVLSNGHLVSKEKNKDGTITWHWQEAKPYSTYLISLAIGNYFVAKDTWRGKPVDYWVYPEYANDAHRLFGLTPKMIEFYSDRTRVPYVWEKYDQVALADFMYGGMENVTATSMNDYILHDVRSDVDFHNEGLIAHELAHQWFGDLVTCRSWIQIWLNESFATYFEAMFGQYQHGNDAFDEEMQGDANAGIDAERTLGKKPIIAANNYTANDYPRGAATLNMIRHILGDSGWWTSIQHYLTVHAYQPVVTQNFKMAIEEATGQNLQWFFDEWLYKSGHPIYDVAYNYDDAAKELRMTVTQTQKRDTLTGTFKMPIDIELTWPDGISKVTTILDDDSTQNFTFPSPEKPAMVIFDKGNTIIKEAHIHKTADEWMYQLAHAKPAIERSEAALAMLPDSMNHMDVAFDALKQAALHDPFWAVRQHALATLGEWGDATHSISDVLATLSRNDDDPRVRAEAIDLLAQWEKYHLTKEFAEPILLAAIHSDSSYNVVGSALNSLRFYDPDTAYQLSLTFLQINSPRDAMRRYVVGILENAKTEASLHQLIALIDQHNLPFWTRQEIIKAIGSEKDVDSALVYRSLWNLTNNGDNVIRGASANTLADIGNAETLHELEVQAAERPKMKGTYDGLLKRMRKRLGVTQ